MSELIDGSINALPVTQHDLPPEALDVLLSLRDQQRAFWCHWSSGLEIVPAMRKAYTWDTTDASLKRYGKRMLRSRKFKLLEEYRRKVPAERYAITEDRILSGLAAIAFTDPRAFFDAEGKLKNIRDLPPEAAMCISEVTLQDGSVTKLKLLNRKQAIDSLAKTQGMFINRHLTEHRHWVVRAPAQLTQEQWEQEHGRLGETIEGEKA